jgi:hypothetical protein
MLSRQVRLSLDWYLCAGLDRIWFGAESRIFCTFDTVFLHLAVPVTVSLGGLRATIDMWSSIYLSDSKRLVLVFTTPELPDSKTGKQQITGFPLVAPKVGI